MSKRKLEATRRNQERKAASGRRTPPGYKGGAKRRRSFGGRRVLAGGGALLVVILLGAVLFATNVFGSDKLAGMKTLIKNGTCTETDFKKSMGRRAHDESEDEGRLHAVRSADLRQALPGAAAAHDLRRACAAVDPPARARARQRARAIRRQGLGRRPGGVARRRAEPPRPHADGALSQARRQGRLHGLAADAALHRVSRRTPSPARRPSGRASRASRPRPPRSTRPARACSPAPAGRRSARTPRARAAAARASRPAVDT